MGRSVSVFRNAFYLYVAQALSAILGLVLIPYITRVLGSDGLGILAFGQAACDMISVMHLSVLPTLGIRRIAAVREDRTLLQEEFSCGLTFQAFFMLLAGALYGAWALFQPQDQGLYLLLLVYLVGGGGHLVWFYSGVERFEMVALRLALARVILLLLTLLLVRDQGDLALYFVLHGGSWLLTNLIHWFGVGRYGVVFRFAPLGLSLKRWLPGALVLLFPSLLAVLFSMVDRVMLGYLDSVRAVAIYSYPMRFLSVCTVLVNVIVNVYYPRLSSFWSAGDRVSLSRFAERMLLFSLTLGFFLGGAFIALPGAIGRFFLGSDFGGSVEVIRMLGFAVLVAASGLYNVGVAAHREGRLVWGLLGVVILLVVNNLWVIPLWGPAGAAVVFSVGTWLLQFYYLYVVRDLVRWEPLARMILTLGVSVVVGSLAVRWISLSHIFLDLVVKIAVYAVSFFACALLVSVPLRWEVREFLNRILARLRRSARG